MTQRIPIATDVLAAYCRRHYVRRLALFGSVLKDTAKPDSDIDLLVEFEPGHKPGYIGLAAMQLELSDLLGGRPVDLRTPDELSRYFRADVMASARNILNFPAM
jgi:predicted nucleotidyltransferase